MTVAYAVSRADLVIIPVQGSHLDAKQATRAIKLIQQQERAFGKKIPYAILFSRTSEAIRPRTLQHIKAEFAKHDVPAFTVHMHERDAFKAIFSFGGTLRKPEPEIGEQSRRGYQQRAGTGRRSDRVFCARKQLNRPLRKIQGRQRQRWRDGRGACEHL